MPQVFSFPQASWEFQWHDRHVIYFPTWDLPFGRPGIGAKISRTLMASKKSSFFKFMSGGGHNYIQCGYTATWSVFYCNFKVNPTYRIGRWRHTTFIKWTLGRNWQLFLNYFHIPLKQRLDATRSHHQTLISISGLWGLEVSHNPVSKIPSMAFYGLERALWQLDLSHNKLTQVPTSSVSVLRKLSLLNLAGKEPTTRTDQSPWRSIIKLAERTEVKEVPQWPFHFKDKARVVENWWTPSFAMFVSEIVRT